MLGCGKRGRSTTSPPDSVAGGGEADLIDHTRVHSREDAAVASTALPKLTWDGRKGQWIPLAYSFSFPRNSFDHLVRTPSKIHLRRLASYSFPPSRRHAVMLDQGSPKLRIIPRSDCKGRHPRTMGFQAPVAAAIPRSPLAAAIRQDRRRAAPGSWAETGGEEGSLPWLPQRQQRRRRLGNEVDEDEDDETEDDTESAVAWEPLDPFNLPSRPVQRMSWLDDIDIEDFLSSAIDYQQTDQEVIGALLPMSEPVIPGGRATGLRAGLKRMSPCTPCSPPPPIFADDLQPISGFKISPLRFTPPKAS